ncbi:lethal(2)neighbour of tid protein [Agrilus planipennis]|uniref:dolichyl-P-Man:Man5GlcNAc2-PP-dolichol alpha-1,3-mannosyltransferase n=1 Tax=Agrilus planipennis TaxID=224129 RepID=A0A7F5RAY7_AGRPL|nr:lethal(2)neighbour of tid protein [Agrilus planipennis]
MAKIKPKWSDQKEQNGLLKKIVQKEFLCDLLVKPQYLKYTCLFLIIFEVFLNMFIIENVRYTEIDWIAYMQEVEGFLNGTFDYKQLKGDTGPLVYPAGFVYVYSLLYYFTSHGRNIHLAQYLFLLIYIGQLCLTFRIYLKTEKVPPYALIISTLTSYRIHSIYVLRLFNDPIAVLLFYTSLNCYISNKWRLGSLFFSLAVSVKMNILLYSPCLLLAFLTNLSLWETILNLSVCGLVQVVLGAPFLYKNYLNYIRGSFDVARVFEHKWTVNYRFLSRQIFESHQFHIVLLVIHVVLLLLFFKCMRRYLSNYAKLNYVFQELKARSEKSNKRPIRKPQKIVSKSKKDEPLNRDQKKFLEMYEKELSHRKNRVLDNNEADKEDESDKIEVNFGKMCQLIVLPFFVTNLIGISCARSLHYQFYSWYFHSLLYLVYCTGYNKSVMFLILAVIEYCWNTYPSTIISSLSLHFSHVALLIGVYRYMNK